MYEIASHILKHGKNITFYFGVALSTRQTAGLADDLLELKLTFHWDNNTGVQAPNIHTEYSNEHNCSDIA
uniref:Uncharacterized protein n=1 Tax=Anguilla anguilla TaxID=7936 RepID=A0A0E9WBD9_ANGAN